MRVRVRVRVRSTTAICAPPGLHLGGQNGTKTDPKTFKNRSEKSRVKKTDPRRSWTRLGAILGRLECHLGALETLWHYACRCFVNIHFFDVKTVRRRLWDQLWPTKAPKRPKMTPKTEPKSTPRRSKIDVKIVIKNDDKTERVGQETGRGVWAGTPPPGTPWEAPQGPRGGGPGPMGPLKSHRFSKKGRNINTLIHIYTLIH